MKKTITFLLAFSILTYWAGITLHAQGKGGGHGPSVNQGHGQAGVQSHGKTTSGHQAGQSSGHETKPSWETKFSQQLQSDPAFQTKIQGLLPAGMDPNAAASGFKNRGQFI